MKRCSRPSSSKPAVAAAAFGHQDAGRENRGRMELNGLHVAERGNAGFQRDRGTHALVDDRVGRDAIDAPEAAGGDAGRARHVGHELARGEVARDHPVAARAVVDQRERLHAFVHRDAVRDRLVAHREQHRVPGAVGDIAGAPLARAAEIARGDEAVRLVALGERDALAVHHHLVLAALHAVPRHAPGRELAHRLRRGVHEHAHHVLVGAPVAAAHGVGEVHVLVVALAHRRVAEARLHAALRRGRVRALGRHQAQHDRLQAAPAHADRGAQPGEAAADDQHVGLYRAHQPAPACGMASRGATGT
jgi:hypothetical protein